MATTKRTYGDGCGIARALDLVGERWALLVVRELVLGPKRFSDLQAGLPRLSPDVLAQRLLALGRWGSRGPFPPGDPPLGADALALALPTLFDPAKAGGLSATYELRLG